MVASLNVKMLKIRIFKKIIQPCQSEVELSIESLDIFFLYDKLEVRRIPFEREVEFLELWLVHFSSIAHYSNLGKLFLFDSEMMEQIRSVEIKPFNFSSWLVWHTIQVDIPLF